MSIQIRCICTWEGKVNDSLAGKKVRCPDCGGTLQVPAAGAAPPAPPVTARAPSPPPAPAPAPPVRTPVAVPPPPPAAASKPSGLGAQSPFTKPLPAAAAPKAPPAAAAAEATKACPFCAETIRAAAVKCRFCGESLDGSGGKKKNTSPVGQQEEIYDTWDSEVPLDEYGDAASPFAPPANRYSSAATSRRGLTGASPLVRLGARFLDGLTAFLAMVPGYGLMVIGAFSDGGPETIFAGFGLLMVGSLAYCIITIILFCSGKSIGKKMLGLTVYGWETTRPAGFGATFLRELLSIVPIFNIIDVFSIFRADHRKFSDLACNTVVVAD